MKINREKYIYQSFHMNSVNFKSQINYAPGLKYNIQSSLNYIYNDFSDIPIRLYDKNYIANLCSDRNFSIGLEKEEVYKILHSSYLFKDNKSQKTPSAGGIYPIEMYAICNNVSGLENGTYHYNREDGGLYFINSNFDISDFTVPNNSFVKKAPLFLVMVANFENIVNKYGSRGYRYVLIECGHIGQNISIVTNKLEKKYCPVGGFYDKKLQRFLNLNSSQQPIYCYSIGR